MNERKTPITIFTPTYNRGYILPALYESLKAQTCLDFEWLITDDCSTDNTQELCEKWMAEGTPFEIRYYRSKKNGGKQRAINDAVKRASYDYFFIVDSDDTLLPDAIEKIGAWCAETADEPEIAAVSGIRCRKSGEYIVRPQMGGGRIHRMYVHRKGEVQTGSRHGRNIQDKRIEAVRVSRMAGRDFYAGGCGMGQNSTGRIPHPLLRRENIRVRISGRRTDKGRKQTLLPQPDGMRHGSECQAEPHQRIQEPVAPDTRDIDMLLSEARPFVRTGNMQPHTGICHASRSLYLLSAPTQALCWAVTGAIRHKELRQNEVSLQKRERNCA